MATKATTAVIAHTAQTLPTVVPGSPARSSRSRVRPGRARPARTAGGVVKADQSRTSPTPNPSPSSTPMSGPAVQQAAHVDADPVVEVGAVRHPLAAHQPVAAALEDRLGLDHVALDPSGHRDDLLHPAYPVGPDGQMHYQVDRGGDGGYDEARRDVLSREEREGTHLDEGLPGAVRVQGRHPRQAGVEREEQVEALLGANLPDDDPRGPHAEALLDQVPQLDCPGPL